MLKTILAYVLLPAFVYCNRNWLLFSNTAGLVNSFKAEILSAFHALGTTVARGSTAADVLKAALYFATASIGPTTTAYTATGEATGTNYTAGGITVTNATAPGLSGTTAVWTPSAAFVYTNVTLAAVDTVLVYNSTQANRAIGAFTFGSQSITAGTLSLSMPVNAAGTALVQVG